MCGWTPCSTTPPPWAIINDKYDDYDKYWPADVHFVGKEIVRFHSIIWPAMLMSMEMPLPKQVFGHGWLLLDGGKMSKSKGNVVDPYMLAEKFGVDALRFFLHAHLPLRLRRQLLQRAADPDHQHGPGQRPGQPGLPHHRHGGQVLRRHAARRAQDLGGHPSRCDDGAHRPWPPPCRDRYEEAMEPSPPTTPWRRSSRSSQRANKYIDETAPWVLAKDMEANGERLAQVLYNLLEATRICGVLLSPFMPESCGKLFAQIGADDRLPAPGRAPPCGAPCIASAAVHQGRKPLPPHRHGQGPCGAGGAKPRPAPRPGCRRPRRELEPQPRSRWILTPSARAISGR